MTVQLAMVSNNRFSNQRTQAARLFSVRLMCFLGALFIVTGIILFGRLWSNSGAGPAYLPWSRTAFEALLALAGGAAMLLSGLAAFRASRTNFDVIDETGIHLIRMAPLQTFHWDVVQWIMISGGKLHVAYVLDGRAGVLQISVDPAPRRYENVISVIKTYRPDFVWETPKRWSLSKVWAARPADSVHPSAPKRAMV